MDNSRSTHPITRNHTLNVYPTDFKKAVSDISAAVKMELSNAQKPFQQVSILMFHWKNDDLNVVGLEHELAHVFEKLYHYKVHRYVIDHAPPNRNPAQNLMARVLEFCAKAEGPNNLLIYVYSGHGWADGLGRDSRICGRGLLADLITNPDIDWNQIRMFADQSQGNILYIMDACYAATGALQSADTEYLAGALMESVASGDPTKSLTNRFTQLLRRNFHTHTAMTVASYAAVLTSEMREPEHEMEVTPVYVPARTKPSSVLAPLTLDPSTIQQRLGATVKSSWAVLVTFRLTGVATVPNVEQFEKYLLDQVPPNVADIKVEAAFRASSQLLLVKMPYEVWACLDENPNMIFSGFVKSGNILAKSGGATVLAERLRGPETIPGSNRSGRSKSEGQKLEGEG